MSKLYVNELHPKTSGTTVDVNSSGKVKMPTPPAFRATRDSGAVAAGNTVTWNNVILDTESAYNSSTGEYVIPEDGIYGLSVTAIAANTAVTEHPHITIDIDGTETVHGYDHKESGRHCVLNIPLTVIALDEGQKCKVKVKVGTMYGNSGAYTQFNVIKLGDG